MYSFPLKSRLYIIDPTACLTSLLKVHLKLQVSKRLSPPQSCPFQGVGICFPNILLLMKKYVGSIFLFFHLSSPTFSSEARPVNFISKTKIEPIYFCPFPLLPS